MNDSGRKFAKFEDSSRPNFKVKLMYLYKNHTISEQVRCEEAEEYIVYAIEGAEQCNRSINRL